MSAFEVPCPHCGRKLKLPDRSLVGRKAKCAKCGHRFILQDPDQLESERPQSRSPVKVEFAPAEDDGLVRDHDIPDVLPKPPSVASVPTGQRSAWPGSVERTDGAESRNASVFQATEQPQAPFDLAVDDADDEVAARIRKRQREARRRRTRLAIAALAVVLVTGAGVAYFLGSARPPKKAGKQAATVARTEKTAAEDEASGDANGAPNTSGRSKPGEPITLQFVPEGARIIVHLRPAELWRTGSSVEEFRACLGPLGIWLENGIKKSCLLEPAKIEEVLFALIPASREEFDVAAVVRSTANLKKSELIEKFDGALVDSPKPHYEGKERAWYVHDARTFASAPKSMAAAMIEAAEGSAISSDGVLALLPRTDRKKHFTLVCELEDVRLGAKSLAPENAQNLVEGLLDFFGDDVETVAWSLQLGEGAEGSWLSSEILARNRLSRAVPKLEADFKKKVAQLPKEILDLVYKTHPKKIGEKKIVGRFPAMTKVVERSARFETAKRLVAMRIELPERAGPNLALGTLLTWDQTTRPDFGQSSAPAATIAAKPNLPEKIADRLKLKVSVEYRADFLYTALDFLSEEIGVKFVLDGPGMKEVGATQNEKQEFAMENAPATAVLDKMLTPKKLVLIVDEQKRTATVTSVPAAERQKLKPFPLTAN